MFTNEIEKGTTVYLRNGLRAEVRDGNKRGSTRFAMVYGSEAGLFDELGSVYATDIIRALINGMWVTVHPTERQQKAMAMRQSFGF